MSLISLPAHINYIIFIITIMINTMSLTSSSAHINYIIFIIAIITIMIIFIIIYIPTSPPLFMMITTMIFFTIIVFTLANSHPNDHQYEQINLLCTDKCGT